MKKYFYAVLAITLAASIYLVVRPQAIPVESFVLKEGSFSETLSGEGKVRSRDKQTVYAFATGSIQGLKVRTGDMVKKGQVLTRLHWDNVVDVKSPMDGVVSKIYRESAGPVVRGEPIFEVSSLTDLEIVVELLTPDAVRLSTHGAAKFLNWGGEGELEGKIFQISRAGAVKTSALGVEEERTEVKLSIEKIPSELREKFGDSYHVDVQFFISEEENVLTVPLGALFKNGDSWAVYLVSTGQRATMKFIKISKKNDREALVLEGLHAGDEVILFPGDKIKEGTLVKK